MDAAVWEACLLTEEWTYRNPAGLDFNAKKELPCLKAEGPAAVPAAFQVDSILEEPGTYSYRIVLQRKDGRRLASTSQEVVVYRGRLEVGVTKDWDKDGRPDR